MFFLHLTINIATVSMLYQGKLFRIFYLHNSYTVCVVFVSSASTGSWEKQNIACLMSEVDHYLSQNQHSNYKDLAILFK